MSSSDKNAGKSNESDKQKSTSKPPSVLSDYVGLPKPQVVHSYVRSMYAWFCGTPTTTPSAPPGDPSTAQVTMAKPKQISVHPSQQARNLIPIDKSSTPDGEPLSGPASAESTSNNTTETNFSDLPSTPSDLTINQARTPPPEGGKEKEQDSWENNMKDVPPSPNETHVISNKSDTDIGGGAGKDAGAATPPPATGEGTPYDDIQFSFMNQLRALEDEKNAAVYLRISPKKQRPSTVELFDTKDFLVPDQEYFANPEKIPQIHPPNSRKMGVKPPAKTSSSPLGALPPLPALPTNIPVPDVKKVGTMITNLIAKVPTVVASKESASKESATSEGNQKEQQPPPK